MILSPSISLSGRVGNYDIQMRIGIIHNYYRSKIPSGENLTVDQIATNLRDLGHTVSFYSETSDRYNKNLRVQALRIFHLFLPIQNKKFRKWIYEQDAIQIHNYFPLIGRFELKAMSQSNIRITRVIHNYRKTCLSGNHFRNSTDCQKCSLQKFRSGIINRCYQKSFWKSLVVSKISKKINNFELARISHFVAISEYVQKYLVQMGVAPEKIWLIPNGIGPLPRINENAKEILLVSRLEPEKGISLAIETWQEYSELPKLNIVGTGSLYDYVSKSTAQLANVEFHGALNAAEVESVAAKCQTLLAPLSWQEPFGRTLVEALSRGQAIVATRKGIASFIVQEDVNGFFCEMNAKSLMSAIVRSQDLDFKNQVSYSTAIWKNSFSTDVIIQFWKNFYNSALGHNVQ
jgi:glycosyltransferase involved in cell wall biosynthesis